MWMLNARRVDEWDRTAALMTLVITAFKGKGTPPVDVESLNPYRERIVDRKPFEHLRSALSGNGRSN